MEPKKRPSEAVAVEPKKRPSEAIAVEPKKKPPSAGQAQVDPKAAARKAKRDQERRRQKKLQLKLQAEVEAAEAEREKCRLRRIEKNRELEASHPQNDKQRVQDELKARILNFLLQEHLIKQMVINHINNRVQEFADPITSTLVLMATVPLQMVFCEEGLLLFKSTHLPLLPYSALRLADKEFLLEFLDGLPEQQLHETYHGCGKYSVQAGRSSVLGLMPKRKLLLAFVDIIMNQRDFKDKGILRRLGDIIVQRFLSSVSVHSDDITAVMDQIWPAASSD